MGATEGMSFLSLRTLNTVTVTLALGLVALVGWHAQNPAHFELIQVPTPPAPNPACCRLAVQELLLWRRLPHSCTGAAGQPMRLSVLHYRCCLDFPHYLAVPTY